MAALCDGAEHTAAMVAEYDARRRALCAGIDVPEIELVRPAGAFYAFPAVDRADGAVGLLEEAGVAVVPGAVFGEGFAMHVRISFAVSKAELDDGVLRIRDWAAAR